MQGLDPIRRRPQMYVGDTEGSAGLLVMMWYVIANALDQFLLGRCSHIDITLHADGSIAVSDDGPGVPVHAQGFTSFLERTAYNHPVIVTADGDFPHWTSGVRGWGIAIVNALSSQLTVHTHRAGILYSLS